MKVHKLSKQDFANVRVFKNAIESVLCKEKFSIHAAEENWHHWDDEDEDKQEILRIRKFMAKNEEVSEKSIDDRILMYEFLKKKYSHQLDLVVMTADILIDNVCDPVDDVLAYRPSLQEIHVAPEQ